MRVGSPGFNPKHLRRRHEQADSYRDGCHGARLSGGASQIVSFSVTPDSAGEYTVDVNGLLGEFTVVPEGEVAEIPTPEEPAPTPVEPAPIPTAKEPVTPTPSEALEAPVIPVEPTTNWWLIGGIIAAVLVIGGLSSYFLWYRRRTQGQLGGGLTE